MDRFRIDGHKLHYHPERVAQWLEADTWEKAKKVYPIYWEITTAANCNHRCTFCSVDAIGYPDIQIDWWNLCHRMAEAKTNGVKSLMFAGTGEPLLHKNINDIVRSAVGLYKLDAAFTTNGIALDRLADDCLSRCSWIKVSLNAGTKESYAKIHKTKEKDWDRVWANIEDGAKRKGSCALGVQCVVLPENYEDMDKLAEKARDSGADYLVLKPYSQGTFSIVQRDDIDYTKMHDELSLLSNVFDTPTFKVIYRENAMKQESETHHYDKCRATPNFWVYSMANGDVFTCSAHLLDSRFKIGNLNRQTFQEIWEGDGRKRQWELMKEFDITQCRKNCRMDKPNRYLHEIKTAEHVNFI